jgi:hypothetical protein
MEKYSITTNQFKGVDQLVSKIKHQIRFNKNSAALYLMLQAMAEGKLGPRAPINYGVLSFIPGERDFFMEALSGECLISQENRFRVSDKLPLMANSELGVATKATWVQRYDVFIKATYLDIFQALPGKWEQKWLSQHQIIKFWEPFDSLNSHYNYCLVKREENKKIDENNPAENLAVVCTVMFEGIILADFRPLDHDNFLITDVGHGVICPLPI